MGNGISDVLRTLYNYNGGEITVTLLKGTKHKVNLSNDGEYLYSITGLGKSNHLKLEWFDKIVKYIVDNGGRVKKGGSRNKNAKVGYENCAYGTLAHYVATECYGKKVGASSYDPIFMVAAILDNAGICKNERGYISINR